MSGPPKQLPVTVDGVSINVWVVKTGKVTYRAYADFRGRRLEGTGTSESGAVGAWQSKANYAANE